ncbi:hypothetical protein EMIHUDRAFT_453008, partial [Emiliania huxleyi CCMP1516]|uniref:ATPase AAA-type core domain-containing protein n=2 Tax=Emiliania huxleyi TaxID=2903 RepID=A0A0D3IC90_EMIH1
MVSAKRPAPEPAAHSAVNKRADITAVPAYVPTPPIKLSLAVHGGTVAPLLPPRIHSQPSPALQQQNAVRLQAAFRGLAARGRGLAARARARSEAGRAAAASARTAEVAARARSPAYRDLRRRCSGLDVEALATVDTELEALVGLAPLKALCASLRRDALARSAVGDTADVRCVLISGAVGTGKKTAATLICRLLRALGVVRGSVTTETTLDQMVLDVRHDASAATKQKADAVLRNFPTHCFVFVGSASDVEALHGGVGHFRRREPSRLALPSYAPAEIASMAAVQLLEAGYSLAPNVGRRSLEAALLSTWPRADIQGTHGCSASQQIELDAASTEPDLRLDAAHGLASLAEQRRAVRAELQALTGMAPLKAFLTQLEAKVEYVARGGDPRLLEGCLNIDVFVERNALEFKGTHIGTLPSTVLELSYRNALEFKGTHIGTLPSTVLELSYRNALELKGTHIGTLPSTVLELSYRNALELKGTHIGWTCPQVKEMVAASMGGCLFLDEAYALSGSRDGDRGDSFADEALRTLLTELENNRTSLCCVLAGYPEAMERLLRADPGLLRRFPHILRLDDYAPGELAAIAASTAHARYGLRLADGVQEALAEHIAREHRADIPRRNASLAVGVVEAAMNRL